MIDFIKTNLSDTWQVEGNNFDDLLSETELLDKRTKTVGIKSHGIQLITIMDVDAEAGNLHVYLHKGNGETVQTDIDEKQLVAAGIRDKEDILSELQMDKLMLKGGDFLYPATNNLLMTLCQRAGCGAGGDLIRSSDRLVAFYRDAAMTRYMTVHSAPVQLVVREDGKLQKVFAAMSSRYGAISQKALFENIRDIFEPEMGAMANIRFTVNNYLTEVYAEFPDKAHDFCSHYGLSDEIVPGMMVLTSDVGDCSCTVYGTYRFKKGGHVQYVPNALFRRAHTNRATGDGIKEGIERHVFPEYTKIPQRLCELLQIDVNDPEATIDSVSHQIHLRKFFGKHGEQKILDGIKQKVSPMSKYTAYDICMWFLDAGDDTVADTTGKSRQLRDRNRNIFMAAAYAKY